jgi:hypothetical protein
MQFALSFFFFFLLSRCRMGKGLGRAADSGFTQALFYAKAELFFL